MKEWIRDILIVLIVFILGLLCGHIIAYKTANKEVQRLGKEVEADYCIQDTADINCIKLNFEKHHIRFSHIVLAQALLESNYFKSKLCIEDNNMFGMRVPAQRFTFATNPHDYSNYAKYNSLEDCILDYKAWQMQNAYNITTEEGYFNLLRNIYAEDPNYVDKLKKLIK